MTEVFVTEDHAVAVVLSAPIRASLLGQCKRAGNVETGGILIGHYSALGDQAVITGISGPPRNSVARRRSFVRGLQGLQRLLNRAWRRDEYYLGEWHSHPLAEPTPSHADASQMVAFSSDPQLRCSEPVLVVVGGDPESRGELWVGVVVRGGLHQLEEWTPKAAQMSGLIASEPSIVLAPVNGHEVGTMSGHEGGHRSPIGGSGTVGIT